MPSVCIVGVDGFIGQNFKKAFPDAITISRNQVNLLNRKETSEFFQFSFFDTIIHCACVGGRRTKTDEDNVFNENVDIVENVYQNANFNRFVWFSSGASELPNHYYGMSKKYLELRLKNDPRVNIYKIWGCFGPGEASHRFFTSGIENGQITIDRDRYFDFVHVEDLIHIVNTVSERFVHVVYKEKYKLSDLAEIAGIPYTITNKNYLDNPYIGVQNIPLELPPLEDRIKFFVSTAKQMDTHEV